MKRAAIPLSTERLEIRLTPAEKKYLKLKAKKCGFYSMADFIMSVAKETPLHDSRYDKAIFESLDNAASALHKIGVNVNQATHALNIQKLQGSISEETISAFMALVSDFGDKQDQLFQILNKIRFQ